MPTYYVRIGHTGYYVEANRGSEARVVALDKYREQYPLRAKLRDPAKGLLLWESDINPIAVTEARFVRHYGER